MSMRELGSYVHQQRLTRQMTQGELAALLDVDRSYLSRIEDGQGAGLGYRIMRSLSAALETPLDRLDALLYTPPPRARRHRQRLCANRVVSAA